MLLAIEHIRSLKTEGSMVRQQAERMKHDADMSRRHQEEVLMLHSEVSAMWNDLQRMDPNHQHIYGSCTNQLAREHGRAAPAPPPPNMLPPMQQAPPSNHWGQAAPGAAMQGVEYPPSGQYDRR